MKIRPLFKWFDFWVGIYWDRTERRLYVLPVPMCGVCIQFEVWELGTWQSFEARRHRGTGDVQAIPPKAMAKELGKDWALVHPKFWCEFKPARWHFQ